MGWPTRTGLRSGLSRAWPRAEIMPPKCHPCLCLGYAGFFGFFARRTSAPKKVDRVQIDPCCQRLQPPFSHIFLPFQHFVHGDFTATSESCRVSHFLVCHRPPFFTVKWRLQITCQSQERDQVRQVDHIA